MNVEYMKVYMKVSTDIQQIRVPLKRRMKNIEES